MPLKESPRSTGANLDADALPFADLATASAADASFEIRNGAVMLKGSRSPSSGSVAFSARIICFETGAADMVPILFGPHGTLYSYATVHVSSTHPTPYAIGYVDFTNGIRVLASVESAAALDGSLPCDTPVELRAEGQRWFVSPSSDMTSSAPGSSQSIGA